jgi:hypothetical protein
MPLLILFSCHYFSRHSRYYFAIFDDDAISLALPPLSPLIFEFHADTPRHYFTLSSPLMLFFHFRRLMLFCYATPLAPLMS